MPRAVRAPRLLPAALCARWLSLIDRRYGALHTLSAADVSVHSSSLRLRGLPELPVAEVWQALHGSQAGTAARHALGPRLACNVDECWVRRQYPPLSAPPMHAPHSWHQDGALGFDFLAPPAAEGALLEMLTCWLPLTACGEDAPGLELILGPPQPLLQPTALADASLQRRFPPEDFWRPALQAGDALLFSGDVLHRTHATAGMRQVRTSLELRFFNADALPARLRGHRFLSLD